jgi:hypothetical protein
MLAVKALAQEHAAFGKAVQVDFVGEVHSDFRAFVLNDDVLKGITTFTATIPHKQLMKCYGESAVLLLVLTGYKDGEGFLPGKLFEYLATGLPVLGVGPEHGDAAALLNTTGAGVMIDGEKTSAIKAFLAQKFETWQQGESTAQPIGFTEYSRRGITKALTDLLR